VDNLTVLINHM